ncbi:unnamed protein product [Echinostoma caproni]|uniref:WD_REPEATS_REGION domain-containing protein n=1 Tax=Echinostoma caproni TaxID=27848 RepID=A0A3P8LBZ2_9TREM|nr:unnamed protein product [Echinostoma caproni]
MPYRTVSTTQFLTGTTTERLISAGADRLCRIWDLRQSRGPLVTIRTDSGINRLSISGSSTAFVGLITGDSTLDSGSAIASSSVIPTTTAGAFVSSSVTGSTVVAPNLPINTVVTPTGNTSLAAPAAAPTGEGPASLLSHSSQVLISTVPSVTQTVPPGAPPHSATGMPGSGATGMAPTVGGSHAQSWATNMTRILALPLENRGIKFFDLNGNRIGRITRSSSRVSLWL